MLINSANLDALRVGFSTAFAQGLGLASSQYAQVATVTPASTKTQKYGWLGKIAGVREWVGARVVQNLTQHDYAITEKKWELTIGVDRDDIETDNLGIYGTLFQEMGASTGSKWDELTFATFPAGFATPCYDGQNFFDTDHPVIQADGTTASIANTDNGAGTPWYLLCTTKPMKPFILQRRKDFSGVVAKDRPEDDNVFNNNEFIYGSDARGDAGYGLWQLAWGSKQTLDAAHYATGRAALMSMKGDHGRPLGLMPNLLVVPPSLEGAGRAILQSQLVNGGESNPWAGTATLLVVPWLA